MQDRPPRPLIGITTDLSELAGGRFRAECSTAYADAVAAAGGLPLLLNPDPGLAAIYASLCDGFILTGGDDPHMEEFGEKTHPAAKPIHRRRQAFEVALLQLLEQQHAAKPVLGICLGMQMMALLAGGRLDQHLPDTCATASRHQRHGPAGDRASHPIIIDTVAATAVGLPWLSEPQGASHSARGGEGGGGSGSGRGGGGGGVAVDSHHHQAISDPGSLVAVGHSDDGLIEVIAAPTSARPFYLGVQWHPERTKAEALGPALFRALVLAADQSRPGDRIQS